MRSANSRSTVKAMADTTLKTFQLECPRCGEEFEIECDPAVAFTEDGDLIECPECGEDCEWEYDAITGALELVADDQDDDDPDDDPDENEEEDAA
jgi:transcription elongation factor Elf1